MRWLPCLLLLGCEAGDEGSGLEALRSEAREICRSLCAHQAEGEGCGQDAFLDVCTGECDDLVAVESDRACLRAWADMHTCWLDVAWVCDGSVIYNGVVMPVAVDDSGCDPAYDTWRAACE